MPLDWSVVCGYPRAGGGTGAMGGWQVLSSFLATYVWAQHLLFTQNKYQVYKCYFPGLLSALQPFSHPLTQLPLIIRVLCETYSRISPGKLFFSPFQGACIQMSRLGNSRLEQTPPYHGTHLYTSKRGTKFLLRKI